MSFATGWFVTDGAAIWATGREYTRDGAQNGRAEVIEFSAGHGAFKTYEWPQDLKPAKPKDIDVALARVRAWARNEIGSHQREIDQVSNNLKLWESRVPTAE